LFSKRIDRIKDVLAAHGIEVGTIEHDRQGIRYFQIHDPEGNVIEVVEEHRDVPPNYVVLRCAQDDRRK
jgi:hypothetical protein